MAIKNAVRTATAVAGNETCGFIKDNGIACKNPKKRGDPACHLHMSQAVAQNMEEAVLRSGGNASISIRELAEGKVLPRLPSTDEVETEWASDVIGHLTGLTHEEVSIILHYVESNLYHDGKLLTPSGAAEIADESFDNWQRAITECLERPTKNWKLWEGTGVTRLIRGGGVIKTNHGRINRGGGMVHDAEMWHQFLTLTTELGDIIIDPFAAILYPGKANESVIEQSYGWNNPLGCPPVIEPLGLYKGIMDMENFDPNTDLFWIKFDTLTRRPL